MKKHVSNFLSFSSAWSKVFLFCMAIALTAVIIYTTPLRFFRAIPPTMHEIDPAAAYKEIQANPGKYIFIDVRQAASYNASHAAGSLSIPIPDVETNRSQLLKSGKTIVLICGDGRSAAVAYGYLQDYGYYNLQHVTGGFGQWQQEGLPAVGTASATDHLQ